MGTKELALRIKTARQSRNISQSQLAEMVGVAASTVGMWEQGRREPDIETLEDLADVFNVPMSYFVENALVSGYLSQTDHDRLEALHQNPRLGMLFDRCRDLPEEDIAFMEQLADRILRERDRE